VKEKMAMQPDKNCKWCKGTGMAPRLDGPGVKPCNCIAMRVVVKPRDWRGR
jgi:hypothetical protein